MNPFSLLLRARGAKTPVGTWVVSASPIVAEAIGQAGFDWGVLDMEHAPLDMMTLVHLLQAVGNTKMVPVVRIPSNDAVTVKRVLDVAGGSAAWSLAWAVEDPEVTATVVDFPEVFDVARFFIDRFGAHDRFELRGGNVRTTDFGSKAYDLVILGHICHSEGAKESAKLIRKSARALKPGGMLLIGEFVPNDARTGPVLPLVFGINMLVNTEEGDVFTMKQYRAWMTAAGLARIRKLRLGPDGPDVIVGEKAEA